MLCREDGGAWNGSADALLRRERDDLGVTRSGGHSGIPVRATGRHSESLAGRMDHRG